MTNMTSGIGKNTTGPGSHSFFIYALLVTWLIVGIGFGRAQSMGLFQIPLINAVGVGRETFGLSIAITFLLMGVLSPFTGALVDKFGAGRVVASCLIFTIAGLYMYYIANSGADLIIGGILLGVGVSGTGLSSLVGLIGKLAPPEKRVSSIATIGMAAGIGSFLALPLIYLLISSFGWQNGLIGLMILFAILVPLALTLGGRIPESGASAAIPKQTLREALKEATAHPSFWLLTAGFFVCGFHVSFITVHLPAFTIDRGLPAWVGPYALMALGIMNLVGTYIAGQSGKWMEKRRALSLIYFMRSIVFVGFLILPITPWVVIGLCTLLGLLWLATIPLTSGLVATFFGTRWMAMLFGIVIMSHQMGAFTGSWLAGWLFDQTNSYETMWYISIALGVISALLHWPIAEKPVARILDAEASAA